MKLTIESKVRHKLSRRLSELGSALLGAGRLGEIGGIGPSSNGKQNLQLSVLLLKKEKLLHTAVDVGSHIVP